MTAAVSDSPADAVFRYTGIWPVARSTPASTGILNSGALARIFGATPLSHRKCANVSGSMFVMWFDVTMNPPSRGKFSVPLQSWRVIARRMGRTMWATMR